MKKVFTGNLRHHDEKNKALRAKKIAEICKRHKAMTISDAAKFLGWTQHRVIDHIHDGQLSAMVIPNEKMFIVPIAEVKRKKAEMVEVLIYQP